MGLPIIKEAGMALHFGKRENELPKPLTGGVTPQRYSANPGMNPSTNTGHAPSSTPPGQVPPFTTVSQSHG